MDIRLFINTKLKLCKYLLIIILLLFSNSYIYAEGKNIETPDKGKDWKIPTLNIEMVWIEQMGIWVGKYPITNEQYGFYKKVKESPLLYGQYSLIHNNCPKISISYHMANEYIDWLNNIEMIKNRLPKGMIYRMPTREEWIKFCKCGDNRIYPWGNELPPKYGNYADLTAKNKALGLRQFFNGYIKNYDDGFVMTCPVEKSGKNTWGLYGVGGNVKEWVFGEIENTEKINCPAFDKLPMAEICGSSWLESRESQLRCETTDKLNVGVGGGFAVGFRLILAPPVMKEKTEGIRGQSSTIGKTR